ncbi:MAG: hypothetical protein H0X61_15295 [Acidimicrobiia bacterium]|nr:hypothetical protein [Acidimicrobiia bacterium]
MRAGSAGCTDLVWHCRARNVGFAVVARSKRQHSCGFSAVVVDVERWQPAVRQDGDERRGASVDELTDLVDLSDWPAETRLIVRREPLHSGPQHSLFPSLMFRHRGHYTSAAGAAVDLDVLICAHALT